MRKSSLIPMMLTLVMMTLWGCQEGTTQVMPIPTTPEQAKVDADGAYRLHEEDLENLGLEIFWTEKLYTQPKETLIDAYLLGDLVVMEAASRRLYGVDRKTGAPVWVVELPNRCDFRGCEDENHIYVPCRNVLIAIDKRGFVTWRKFLKFAPSGIPAADETHVYVPCFDGRMRAFFKSKGYFDRQYTTKGELEAQPALGSRLVYTGSNDGWLYALTADRLDLSWKYQTYGPIRAGVVFDKRSVYVASTDGNLHSLDDMPQATREQQSNWHRPYATGAAIEQAPYLTKNMVLVVNRHGQCHAVDRQHGRVLWIVPNVNKVLTQGRLNTYLLRGNSCIVAVDNKTGIQRWQKDTRPGSFAFFLTNPLDDTLYLVKRNGETQAIRERRLTKPAKAPAK